MKKRNVIITIAGLLFLYPIVVSLWLSHQNKSYSNFSNACRGGSIKSIKKFLKKGYDINKKRYPNGPTPFMKAAKCGNVAIVKFLIKKGAKINLSCAGNTTALFMACDTDKENGVIKVLLNNGAKHIASDGFTPLMMAVARENLYNVEQILIYCKDLKINEKSESGKTALDVAHEKLRYTKDKNNLELIIENLKDKGAKLNKYK